MQTRLRLALSNPPRTTMPSSPQQTKPPPPATPSTILYHLGYRLPDDQPLLETLLTSTRYVILCGSSTRAAQITHKFNPCPVHNLCRSDRYTLYKPRSHVLVAAHGIGMGSIDVLLHELHAALVAARARDWRLVRVGTCGGIAVPPGTLVVTRRPLNGMLQPGHRMFVLGQERCFPAQLNPALSKALHDQAVRAYGECCVIGDTVCAETFHVAQGRFDGAFTEYSREGRDEFLNKCREKGVVNFEMESLPLASFATKVGVAAAVVCTVLVDRMKHETPTESEKEIKEHEERAVNLVVSFVANQLNIDVGGDATCEES